MEFKVERPVFKNEDYNIIQFGAKSDIAFNNR